MRGLVMPKEGDLLNLPERDVYGVGALQLRVIRAEDDPAMPDWVKVTGVQILWNGDRLGERTVFVARDALCRAAARGTQ